MKKSELIRIIKEELNIVLEQFPIFTNIDGTEPPLDDRPNPIGPRSTVESLENSIKLVEDFINIQKYEYPDTATMPKEVRDRIESATVILNGLKQELKELLASTQDPN